MTKKSKITQKQMECLFDNLLIDLVNVHSIFYQQRLILKENELMIANLDKLPEDIRKSALLLQQHLLTKEEIINWILNELENLVSPHYSVHERVMTYKNKNYVI